MSDNNKVETKLDDSVTPEMWERARYFADAIGPVPSLFTACVRAIGKVEAVLYPIDTESVRDLAVASAEFLVGTSPTLKSVFYWARAALYPDAIPKEPDRSVHELLRAFAPGEISAIIGVTFLYRRSAKLCCDTEWQRLGRKIKIQAALGWSLGTHMNFVGAGNGFLIGAIRNLSLASFAVRDSDTYKKYRRSDKPTGTAYDTHLEQILFGCTHLHVASLLVQSLGCCLWRSPLSMGLSMDAMNVKDELLPGKVRSQLLSLKALSAAIEYMHFSREFCCRGEGYELVLPPETEASLKLETKEIIRSGGCTWLDRGAADLPSEVERSLSADHGVGLED